MFVPFSLRYDRKVERETFTQSIVLPCVPDMLVFSPLTLTAILERNRGSGLLGNLPGSPGWSAQSLGFVWLMVPNAEDKGYLIWKNGSKLNKHFNEPITLVLGKLSDDCAHAVQTGAWRSPKKCWSPHSPVFMNGILFGNRIFADIIKLKFVPTGLGWTRIQYLVSLLGEESLDTEMLLQKTVRWRRRCKSNDATNQVRSRTASNHQKVGKDKEGSLSGAFRGSVSLPSSITLPNCGLLASRAVAE